jgi:mitotic spindle assembly checkpoint protein MAD2
MATQQQQQSQMQMQKTSQNITLRGSTEIVTEFFGYAVNSILYQRGLYPPSTFEVKKKYGLGMLVSSDEEIKTYLVSVLDQINEWLIEKKLEKLVLVISSVRTRETVERWVFDIETDSEIGLEEDGENVKPPNNGAEEKNKKYEKSKQDITNEIAAIMRQIAASVTFLPLLEDECSFDLIVYTNKDSETPQEWEESDPRFIRNAETVKLRSFSTKVHSVEAAVAYKAESPLNV